MPFTVGHLTQAVGRWGLSCSRSLVLLFALVSSWGCGLGNAIAGSQRVQRGCPREKGQLVPSQHNAAEQVSFFQGLQGVQVWASFHGPPACRHVGVYPAAYLSASVTQCVVCKAMSARFCAGGRPCDAAPFYFYASLYGLRHSLMSLPMGYSECEQSRQSTRVT